MNVLLQQGGLQQMGLKGALYDWHAYSQSNGKSTTIHLRDNCNQKLYDKVYAYLQKLQEDPQYGIEKIWTKDELAEAYGQGGPYSFMVEAEDGYGFANSWTAEHPVVPPANGATRGTHGHTPERGPQPIFMAHGPDFKEGVSIPNAKLVDIAPTLAAVLGQTLADADGRVMTELLK
jgi:predicted AlkP superfamily pyrophosphatase or phosphodiesterase